MTRPNDAAGEAPARLDDPRDDKHPPTQVRLRWIVSMMWELGMYTQAREVQRLGDAFFAGSESGPCPENNMPCEMGCTGGWCVTLFGQRSYEGEQR